MSNAEQRPQSFGEKAVGLSFNPSHDQAVFVCKSKFSEPIDQLDKKRVEPLTSSETRRLCSVAITEIQGAQMWAVKALTWKD